MAGIVAALVLASFAVSGAQAQASPLLEPGWEGGALVIRASGFAANEQVTFAIGIDGAPTTLTAVAGPTGSFALFTELAVRPGQSVSIHAAGQSGSRASTSVVVPDNVPPRTPIRLLPMDGQAPGPGIADVSGPGQAVSRPAARCPRTVSCVYAERNLPPDGYRFQSLQLCGANCTTQYWVSNLTDGQQLAEIDPVRGGAVLAVAASAGHGAVRVVAPSYASGDPACCPSGYSDTTFTWDAAADSLVAGEPIVTPASDFPGWDAVRRELQAEGWILAGV